MKKYLSVFFAFLLTLSAQDPLPPNSLQPSAVDLEEDDDDEDDDDLVELAIDEIARFLCSLRNDLERQYKVTIDMEDVIQIANEIFSKSDEFSDEEKEFITLFYDEILERCNTQKCGFWGFPGAEVEESSRIPSKIAVGICTTLVGILHESHSPSSNGISPEIELGKRMLLDALRN